MEEEVIQIVEKTDMDIRFIVVTERKLKKLTHDRRLMGPSAVGPSAVKLKRGELLVRTFSLASDCYNYSAQRTMKYNCASAFELFDCLMKCRTILRLKRIVVPMTKRTRSNFFTLASSSESARMEICVDGPIIEFDTSKLRDPEYIEEISVKIWEKAVGMAERKIIYPS